MGNLWSLIKNGLLICGYLDLKALKLAKRLNGATGILLTKVDILPGLGPIKVCVDYEEVLGHIRPKYLEFDPVDNFGTVKEFKDLPISIKKLCHFMEDFLELKIKIISFGPNRGDEIFV